ncbi:MAG TPA: hypothetical protein VGH87_09755 [Polyangiaceae bacterium]
MRAAILLSALLLACSPTSSNPDGGADASSIDAPADVVQTDAPAGSGDAGGPATFCTSETPTVVASEAGPGLEATTTHYDLYAETTSADATDVARLLEASGAAFASWFDAPQPASRLKVKYYADQNAFTAGLAADGIQIGSEAGGYYASSTQTAYLYKQGNPYYSHVLLVHEATHQFHFITRLKNPSPAFWYVEGHAEYLSRHDWDGKCVRLGVMSLLSWEDLPAQGLAEGPIDVPNIIGGSKTGTRADAWAIVRFLDTGSHRASFQAFRDAYDANTAPSFDALVAPPSSLVSPLASWLPSAQEPMKPIFTEWIHVGPAAVDVDTPGVFSLAIVKSTTPTHLEAKFAVSGNFDVGVVVAYTDSTHYTGVVHGNDGNVRTFTANGTAIWNNVGTAPAPSGGVEVFSVDFANGMAHVTFNGASVDVSAPTPHAGIAANDTTGHFTALGWQ